MLKRLYNWTLDLAGRPYATYALAAVSFAESSFFPIPPDVMLVPMALAQPKKIWWYATVCSIASVLGGILGYMIGMFFIDTAGVWILELFHLADKRGAFEEQYALYGHWVILIKGFTPIPFKLVTITSGAAGYSLPWFIGLSIITRSGRFFFVALLMSKFGPFIKKQLDAHLTLILTLFVVALVGGFYAFKYVF